MEQRNICMLCYILVVTIAVTTSQCPTGCDCTESDTLMKCIRISSFPNSIPSTIQEAIFDQCTFDVVTPIPTYENVHTLLITNSQVTNITYGAFSQLTKLSTLDMAKNRLTDIHPDMFSELSGLMALDLSGNRIKLFPAGLLKTLPQLQKLKLGDNVDLSFHVDTFQDSQLKHLNVDKCGFTSIPTSILSSVPSLTNLEMGNNQFTSIGKDAFKGLNLLEQLNMVQCAIENIDEDSFKDLKSLKNLNLAFNKLSSLDEEVFEEFENSIQELHLQHNMLTTLDHDISKYDNLNQIGLAGNPWNCDCEISWMSEVKFYVEKGDNITCHSPPEFAGLDLKNVTTSMDCPCGFGDCDDKKKIALYIAIPILIICVLLICYFVYKIIQNKKEKAKHNSVRYSEVYRETTESTSKKEPLV